jgi:hypothetical protein
MLKKIILSFFVLTLVTSNCKKTEEIFNEIKDAYWSDIDGLVVKVEDKEGYVLDFGESDLGSNQNVFNPTMPYFKNIERKSANSWTADAIKSTYDNFQKLEEITYESTTINLTTGTDGEDVITQTDANSNSKEWTKEEESYVPPVIEQEITCDTLSSLTTSGNTLKFKQLDYKDFPVRSRLTKPLNHDSQTQCHYLMDVEKYGISIMFSHKPTKNEIFTLVGSKFNWIFPLEPGTAMMISGYYDQSYENSGVIEVSASGGQITASGTNIELRSDQSTNDGALTLYTFKLSGK